MMFGFIYIYRCAILVVVLFQFIYTYKPVVLVHGLFSDGDKLNDLKKLIIQSHPNTNVTVLKYLSYLETLDNLSFQLRIFNNKMKRFMKKYKDGFHIICHSQGGLLCLGLLESVTNHNIETFIALSTPIFGQYGLPKVILRRIPVLRPIANLTRELLSPFIYRPFLQKMVSIANYWKDPRLDFKEDFETRVRYLTEVTNDPNSKWFDKTEAALRKQNFLKLKKLVLIGGPDDGVIMPWQSSLFGYYGPDSQSETIVEMTQQKMFLEDWFGLKTLHNRGGVSSYVFANVKHNDWHGNKTVFHKAIEPWLT